MARIWDWKDSFVLLSWEFSLEGLAIFFQAHSVEILIQYIKRH